MECYGTALFEMPSSNEGMLAKIKNYIENELDLHIEGKINKVGSVYLMSFIGGSSLEDELCELLNKLSTLKCPTVKGYWQGDEDPFVELLWVDETDNSIDSFSVDSGVFDTIAEMEIEDADDLCDYKDLQVAYQQGPRDYFMKPFTQWQQGIPPELISDLNELVEEVIESSKEVIEE